MKFANRFTYPLNYNRYTFSYSLIGVVLPFAGTNIPYGWYECNGAELSRKDYSVLFSKIGIIYGSGNGTTTFNIPDFREKTFWGLGGVNANLGDVRASALPNITGRSSMVASNYAGIPGSSITQGAFTAGAQFYSNTRSGEDVQHLYVHFSAHNSNAVYKDGQTIVQPPAIVVKFIIKAI